MIAPSSLSVELQLVVVLLALPLVPLLLPPLLLVLPRLRPPHLVLLPLHLQPELLLPLHQPPHRVNKARTEARTRTRDKVTNSSLVAVVALPLEMSGPNILVFSIRKRQEAVPQSQA